MGNNYTHEDFEMLVEIICNDLRNQRNDVVTMAYYESMRDVLYYVGIKFHVSLRKTKKNFRNYSEDLYKLIYKTKLGDVPLYINSTTFLSKQIVKWRLKIGK